jgi:hypothetical protein
MWTSTFFTGKLLPKSDLIFFNKWTDFWGFEPFEDFYIGFSAVVFSWQKFSISQIKLESFFNLNSAKFLFFVKIFQIFDFKEMKKKHGFHCIAMGIYGFFLIFYFISDL